MPFFPQLPEIDKPQLFKGDIPTLLKDLSQLKSEEQTRSLKDIAAQKEQAEALPAEEVIGAKRLGIKGAEQEMDINKIKKAEALMDVGLKGLQAVTSIDEYSAFREEMIDLGASPTTVPELKTDEDLEKYRDDIRQEIALWKGKAGKGTPLQELYSQLDAEKNPLRRKEIQAAIDKEVGTKQETEELTAYHKDGGTKRFTRFKGSDLDPAKVFGEGWSLKAPTKGGAGADKKLSDIAKDYMTQIGRYYQSKRGVGQFIQDPNKEQVADEAATSAENLAIQYVKDGGNPGELGITKEGIREDLKNEKIDKEKAIYLLRNLFKME